MAFQLALPRLPAKPVALHGQAAGNGAPAESRPNITGLALPSAPAKPTAETSSALPTPPVTPKHGVSAANIPAPAAGKKGKALAKRTEAGEKVAKAKRQDKSTRKRAPAAEKIRFRCIYGCNHRSPLTQVVGFTRENLRKHMRHSHRVFNNLQDQSRVVTCCYCKRLNYLDDKDIVCNKSEWPCKASAKEWDGAQVPWPMTDQEFADTFCYVTDEPSRDVRIVEGDDDEVFTERLLRALEPRVREQKAAERRAFEEQRALERRTGASEVVDLTID